jgi:hypothetical protein
MRPSQNIESNLSPHQVLVMVRIARPIRDCKYPICTGSSPPPLIAGDARVSAEDAH